MRQTKEAAMALRGGLRAFGPVLQALLVATLFALVALAWPAPASAQQPRDPGYVLGPGDGITVLVYGQNEFDVKTRVKPDGSIVMPLIGKVEAEGRNVIQLADDVTRRLVSGNFLRDPIVNVEVNEYVSRYVRVAGKVGASGLVPLDRSTRILDVLLRSGWVRDDGAEYVLLRRAADGKEVRINSDELARGLADNIPLSPGDTIFVPDAELVYITGQINRAGGYPLKPGMNITQLLAQAGGVGPSGSQGRFGLKRGGSPREIDADQTTLLQPGDIVNVRERLF